MKEGQEKFTKISELRLFQKNVNCVFIVLEKATANTKTKDNHNITHTLVADQTGSVNLSIWDDIGELIQPGDLMRLNGGYTSPFKGSLILYVGKYGSIQRIGEFMMAYSETPNMSQLQWTEDQLNPKKSSTPSFKNNNSS